MDAENKNLMFKDVTFYTVLQFIAHFLLAISDGNLTFQEVQELFGIEGGLEMVLGGVMAAYLKYKK